MRPIPQKYGFRVVVLHILTYLVMRLKPEPRNPCDVFCTRELHRERAPTSTKIPGFSKPFSALGMATVPRGGAGKLSWAFTSKFQAGGTSSRPTGRGGEEWELCSRRGETVGEGVDVFCEGDGTGAKAKEDIGQRNIIM